MVPKASQASQSWPILEGVEPRPNPSNYAGSWYPAEAADLEALLRNPPDWPHLPCAGPPPEEVLSGAVLPHAGLFYSAPGQAALWNRWYPLKGRAAPEAVVIVSPSHYAGIPRGCLVGASFSRHETPLGDLPGLLPPFGVGDSFGDRDDPPLLAREHGLELLLPGLRCWAGAVPTALLLTGPVASPGEATAAARRLLDRFSRQVDPRKVLWLASSDFTHYGPRFGTGRGGGRPSRGRGGPAGSGGTGSADALRGEVLGDDLALAEAASSGDLHRYWAALKEPSSVCGRFAIALVLAVLDEIFGSDNLGGRPLCCYTSADRQPPPPEGDREALSFVSYATLEITRRDSREGLR